MSLPDRAAMQQAIASRRGWAEQTLSGWVRHASVLGAEAGAQEYIAGVLEGLGLAASLVPVDPDRIRLLPGFSPADWSYEGRPNVVGVHEPQQARGRSLILNGHVDVVSPEPAALWTAAPFEPRLEEEGGETWLYGRGAGDMKGGTVCALWALAALGDMGLEPAARVMVQSVIEEECTGNGTLALCAAGHTADACLIPEPFGETLMVSQVGVLWFQVRVLGRTTHVLGAGRGVNAIEKSWEIIRAMRSLEQELNHPDAIPPLYEGVEHPINLNVGTIHGGDWASTVAGECVTRFRLGLFPGQRCAGLMRRVEQRVAEVAAADPWLRDSPPAVEYIGFQAEGCALDTSSDFFCALGRAHRLWRGSTPRPLRATCATDARYFDLYQGVPVTCYGPKAREIHAANERVSVDSMARVAQVWRASSRTGAK